MALVGAAAGVAARGVIGRGTKNNAAARTGAALGAVRKVINRVSK